MLEDPGATRTGHAVMRRTRCRTLWVGTVLAIVLAGGQGGVAFGASSPGPSPKPGRAQSMAAEQSEAGSSAQALGLGSGEKLVVKDVITDSDGTTNVRYNRTFDGLRVIGGDFVSHRDKSGKIKGVSWNGSHKVAVASTKPTITLAAATVAGDKKAALVQRTTGATKGELVVYSGSASAKATPKLAYDVLTVGIRADQTPSRLHTIVDADSGATLASWDEIQNEGTGNSLYVGQVSIGTTGGPPWTMSDSVATTRPTSMAREMAPPRTYPMYPARLSRTQTTSGATVRSPTLPRLGSMPSTEPRRPSTTSRTSRVATASGTPGSVHAHGSTTATPTGTRSGTAPR